MGLLFSSVALAPTGRRGPSADAAVDFLHAAGRLKSIYVREQAPRLNAPAAPAAPDRIAADEGVRAEDSLATRSFRRALCAQLLVFLGANTTPNIVRHALVRDLDRIFFMEGAAAASVSSSSSPSEAMAELRALLYSHLRLLFSG